MLDESGSKEEQVVTPRNETQQNRSRTSIVMHDISSSSESSNEDFDQRRRA